MDEEDTRQMDRKSRKRPTIHRSNHPRDGASKGFYLHQAVEFLLKEMVPEGFVNDFTDPVSKKRGWVDQDRLQFEEKKLHSVFFRETKGVRDEKYTWLWLKKEC